MKLRLEATLIPPSFDVEYEISRDEIRAVGRNIGIVGAVVVAARVFVALVQR